MIEIRYTDLAGIQQGPFEFNFEPKQESEDVGRRTLEITETAWVSFQEDNRRVLLYFTHLMVFRGALEKIDYGLNTDTPNQNFNFPKWTTLGMATIDARTRTYINIGSNISFVTVQLTYKNGDKSPVVRFDRQ